MKKSSRPDRVKFDTYTRADATFDEAANVCSILCDVADHDPLYYPLMVALHVLYGRPFREQGRGRRLPESIVPASFVDKHKLLIARRNKMFAHIDETKLVTDGGANLNSVVLEVSREQVIATNRYEFAHVDLDSIRALCDSLSRSCARTAEAIWRDHLDANTLSPGTYQVNLSQEDPGDFIVQREL